jgi:NTP pyrophosphatase (non-canonical NTP hydrolase)
MNCADTDINEYAEWTEGFWFSGTDRSDKESLAIMGLGLAGEAGETVEHIKKFIRDGNLDREALKKELGDVIYYWSRVCRQFNLLPSDVLQANKDKLISRRERGKLRGDGDNR